MVIIEFPLKSVDFLIDFNRFLFTFYSGSRRRSGEAPGSPSGEIIAIQNLGSRRKCDGFPGTGFHWRELKSYLPRYENLRSAATCRVPIGFFFFSDSPKNR